MDPNLTIAIPSYNDDPHVFGRVLDAAIVASGGGRVLVVDMSTSDAVHRTCEAHGRAVAYEAFPGSRGVANSRNRCVELAGTRHVAFLDSDAIPHPDYLVPLARRLADDGVAVVGSRILPAWDSRVPSLMRTVPASHWLSLLDLGEEPIDVPRVIGTSYAIDRSRTPDPPFDESLGRRPGWGLAMEENALCESVRAEGWRVVYEPDSVVFHQISAARASWRWMWRRAYAAGRETRARGRPERMPGPREGLTDLLFKALVAGPFLAGLLTRNGHLGR